MEGQNCIDRISELPEHIFHHILSSLLVRDAAQTSLVSKRWYQVWSTLPYLNFGIEFFPSISSDLEIQRQREQLFAFVNQTLIRHKNQGTNINKFELVEICIDNELSPYLDRWTENLVECNIKELVLDFEIKPDYCLPSSLLNARSLTMLKLCHCKLPRGDIKWSLLRKLHLEFLHLDDDLVRDITNGCPWLEHLVIDRCHGFKQLTISGFNSLKVADLSIKEEVDEVEIDIPNLEVLDYHGVAPIKVGFNSCKNLKYLSFFGPVKSKRSFEVLSELPVLEELCIANVRLESIKIVSYSLKKLSLFCSNGLTEVEFDTPHLTNFRYEGELSDLSYVNLGEVVVELHLTSIETNFVELVQFFSKFINCRVLKLYPGVFKRLIITKEERATLSATIGNIKSNIRQLMVVGKFYSIVNELVGLVDSLMWLIPCLEGLTIRGVVGGDSFPMRYPLDLCAKFTYEKLEDKCHRCVLQPRECWKHTLQMIKFEKLAEFEAEVCRSLKNYLLENAKNLSDIEGL